MEDEDGKKSECLFFQSGKKSNDKALTLIKMLLFLKTIMASCANIPATKVSSWLWQWRLSGSSVFTLKQQDVM